MIDDIEKILSKEVDDWTEEEMIRILGPRDTYTQMKCSKCGYEEKKQIGYLRNLAICTNKKKFLQSIQNVMRHV